MKRFLAILLVIISVTLIFCSCTHGNARYGNGNAFISSRFQIIEYSENFFGFESVIVDKETGVLYLWTKVGYGAGLTPLLDSEGNVQFYDGK